MQIYLLCLWAGSLFWHAPFKETTWEDSKHIQMKGVAYFKLFPQENKKYKWLRWRPHVIW